MTPSETVHDWLNRENGNPALWAETLSLPEARELLRTRDSLLTIEVPSGTFDEVTRGLRPFTEALIERLIRIEDLTISDDLREVLDRGLYNPQLSRLFETLWSARFQYAERQDAQASLAELIKDTFEETSVALRCDALLFWLTLLDQNYPVAPRQLTLIIQGPEDDDLTLFLLMSEAWSAQGCPLRSLVLVS